jgi:hypothetical protein
MTLYFFKLIFIIFYFYQIFQLCSEFFSNIIYLLCIIDLYFFIPKNSSEYLLKIKSSCINDLIYDCNIIVLNRFYKFLDK